MSQVPPAEFLAQLLARLEACEAAAKIQNEVIARLRSDLDRIEESHGELETALANAVRVARGKL